MAAGADSEAEEAVAAAPWTDAAESEAVPSGAVNAIDTAAAAPRTEATATALDAPTQAMTAVAYAESEDMGASAILSMSAAEADGAEDARHLSRT